jgi:general secretion pathway protein F/type IV pilus assembly protein PilC
MPFYSYKAVNNYGEVVKGLVEESSMEVAYDNVTSSGLHMLKIQKSDILDFYLRKFRTRMIKTNDIIEFANNLSFMQRAGLPLLTSISDIADSIDNKYFRERLLDIRRNTELGLGFSESLKRHNDVFPEIFINLIAVGEETGRLSESLSDIAVHLQRMEDLKNAIIRALMYPAFAFLGTTGALLFWLIYVLPQMSELFIAMDVELPVITQALISASDFSRSYWYAYILVPLFFYVILKLLSKKKATKYYLDKIALNIPIVKLILRNKLLALFSEQLRILTSAGVTIDRSLNIMISVMNNIVFSRVLEKTKEDVMLGSMISEAIKKHPALFPNLAVRMISIGESTGNLTEQLNYLSEYFLAKLDDISQKMGKMIEPIIIILIGGMFVVIILGLLSPIYDLVAGAGK